MLADRQEAEPVGIPRAIDVLDFAAARLKEMNSFIKILTERSGARRTVCCYPSMQSINCVLIPWNNAPFFTFSTKHFRATCAAEP